MNLHDLFQPRAVPTSIDYDSTPLDVLTYIKHHGLLEADVDFLTNYILNVTPKHPDESEDEHCVDEIERFTDRASLAQEAEELRWEKAVNDPSHPDHEKEWAKLNE